MNSKIKNLSLVKLHELKNIVSETIDGNDAEVVLTTKNISGQNVRITVKLLVDEGRWKVDGDHGVWH